jgi:hypothetical protein
MSLLSTLATLLSLAAFVGWIWLVVVAFKQKPLWGILVLLLSPFAAIFFAVKHWEEAKKPFLIHIGCFVCSIGLTVVLFTYMASPMIAMAAESSKGDDADPAKFAKSMDTMLHRVEQVGDLDAEGRKNVKKMRQALNDMQDEAAASGSEATTPEPGALPEDVATTTARNEAQRTIVPPPPMSGTDGSAAAAAKPLVDRDGYMQVPTEDADAHLGAVVRVVEAGGAEVTGKLTSADETRLFLEKAFSTGTMTIEVARRNVETFQVFMR